MDVGCPTDQYNPDYICIIYIYIYIINDIETNYYINKGCDSLLQIDEFYNTTDNIC